MTTTLMMLLLLMMTTMMMMMMTSMMLMMMISSTLSPSTPHASLARNSFSLPCAVRKHRFHQRFTLFLRPHA